MKKKKDIFSADLLPQEIRKKIGNPNYGLTEKILELFALKLILTLREIRIGLYNKHKLLYSANTIAVLVWTLSKNKRIKRIATGTYQLIRKRKNG